MSINNGDLVYVSHLPSGMSHFTVCVGVVCQRDRRGEFFIQRVNSKGKMIKDSEEGWYEEANVKVLVKGYLRGKLDGKNVYKEVNNVSKLIMSVSGELKRVQAEAHENSRAFWARLGL